jgi:indolepyruvate ferredoxin oxidoreductase beta subunit
MKEQIVISGIGGQGTLFLTRVLAEAAIEKGLDVLTSETHGMAMRGGSVISHVKVGPFTSPLIRMGQADCGLFLHAGGLEVHRDFLKPEGRLFINAEANGDGTAIDATRLAREHGTPLVANLVLLGFAIRQGGLFCDAETVEAVIRRISPAKQLDMNLKGLRLGLM